MRYKELLEQKTLPEDIKDSLPPTFVMPGLQNSDYYRQYRHLIALAAARSRTESGEPLGSESAWGENQAVVCYTKADEETLKLANKIMGVTSKALSDSPSHEMPDTNKVSPVRKFVELSESVDHKNGTFVDASLTAESAKSLYNWCNERNIPCISPEKMHVTMLFSRTPVPQLQQVDGYRLQRPAKLIKWEILGNCLVLTLNSKLANTIHNFCKKHGGSHDYPKYIPHITIAYDYQGQIPSQIPNVELVLDSIGVNELDLNWKEKL